MAKIVVAGLTHCLGSAFLGLCDALELARCAVARATGETAPFFVLTASPGGAPVVDGAGRVFPVATALEEISGCDAVAAPGFHPDDGGQPPLLSALSGAAAWLRRTRARRARLRRGIRRSLFHNRLRVAPLRDADGQTLYFPGIQCDVSAPVKAELDIGSLNERLAALSEAPGLADT